MSLWQEHNMDDRVRAALQSVHLGNPHGHHFGRPYISPYQIAISLVEADPQLLGALGKEIGGRGTGAQHSLAQYVANELSRGIRTQGDQHYVEGAFLSNERVRSVVYEGPGGQEIVSSLVGTDFDMSLFRLRE